MALLLQQRPLSSIADDLDKLSAELRAHIETTVVSCGSSIQAAINSSQPGDTILLEAGCRYVGGLTLPARAGVVTLRSGGSLPTRRVGPADLPTMATVINTAGPVINGTGATHWVIDGIALEGNTTGEVITLQDALNVKLDRLLIVGGVNGQKRGIRGNGQSITLTRSYCANVWAPGQDSQCFAAWDGAGPYTITDNYLEAASENVMFGGADSKSADRIPADIVIAGNLFTKRLEWKPVPPATTSGKAVKNILEFKAARRVIVSNNVFERSWTDAQNGYAILFKSVNQNGTAPWSQTDDVLFENNIVREAENGINIQGFASDQPGGRTTGIVIRSNDITTTGVAVQITGAPGTVTIDRTTFVNGYTFIQFSGLPMDLLTVTNTLANHNQYGVKGDATGIGTASLTKFCKAYVWADVALLGGSGTYPPTTYFSLASVPAGVIVGK